MEKEQYFQSIIRCFLRLRGAPFFLSAKELLLIESWEKANIPVRMVLEGINSAYENFRKRPGPKGRAFSLAFCRREVERAYNVYQSGKVGQKQRIISSDKKYASVSREIKGFLHRLPHPIQFLELVFMQLERRLDQGEIDEEGLEQEEEKIEDLLWRKVSQAEKSRFKKELRKEYGLEDIGELEQLVKIKLLKEYRDRYKIPHVSLFYY